MAIVQDRIALIADVLLGAVYADEKLDGEEEKAVRKLLRGLLRTPTLPDELEQRLTMFRADNFDVSTAARPFASDPPGLKRKLLELVAAVRDADDEIDFAEDEYMVALAKALEMPPDDYRDLVLDYEVEELRTSFEELRRV